MKKIMFNLIKLNYNEKIIFFRAHAGTCNAGFLW